jgi:hypothetical protein
MMEYGSCESRAGMQPELLYGSDLPTDRRRRSYRSTDAKAGRAYAYEVHDADANWNCPQQPSRATEAPSTPPRPGHDRVSVSSRDSVLPP